MSAPSLEQALRLSQRGDRYRAGGLAETGRQPTAPSGPGKSLLPGLAVAGIEFIDHHSPHAEFLWFARNGHRYVRHHSDETGNLVVRNVSLAEIADVLY